MKYRIISEANEINQIAKLISPNFIYNRFDLSKNDYELYEINSSDKNYYIEVCFKDKIAKLGIWLMDVPCDVVSYLIDIIFSTHKHVHYVEYAKYLYPLGTYKKSNHFKIDLPETIEELDLRLHKKGRYNLKREKRILEDDFSMVSFLEYDRKNCPKDVMDTYFKLKQITHKKNYNLSSDEYFEKYFVTNIYELKLDDKTEAVILSCEQADTVYIENLTYDTQYSKYSLGQILYDEYLKKLILKGKKGIFLSGGDYQYKKRYGSVEDVIYDGYVSKNALFSFTRKAKTNLKNFIKKILFH